MPGAALAAWLGPASQPSILRLAAAPPWSQAVARCRPCRPAQGRLPLHCYFRAPWSPSPTTQAVSSLITPRPSLTLAHTGRISTQTVVLTSVLTLVAVTGVLPTLAILCLRYVPCAGRLRARLGARLGARHADAPPRHGWPLATAPPAAWRTLRLDPRRGSGPGWAAEVKVAPGSAPVRPLVVVLAPDGGVALAEGPGYGVVRAPGEGGKGAEDVAVLGSRRHAPDLEGGCAGAPPGRVTSYLSAGL